MDTTIARGTIHDGYLTYGRNENITKNSLVANRRAAEKSPPVSLSGDTTTEV